MNLTEHYNLRIAGMPRACILTLAITLAAAPHPDAARAVRLCDTTLTGGDSVAIKRDSVSPPNYLPSPFEMVTNLPRDWWRWCKGTFRVENVGLFSSISAVTGAMVATDHESWQLLKEPYDRYRWFREASDYASFMGDGKFQGGIAVAFAVYGFVFNDTTALRTASQTVEVILACGAVVQLLKHLTGRESPFVATSPTGQWRLFPNQIEYLNHVPQYDAFPSGHVATALATLTVIAENYPNQKWIRWVGYPIVASIAVGLVATGIHWWSDFPLSIALGYGFGMLVAHHDDPEPLRTAKSLGYNLKTSPNLGIAILSDGTPAVGATWSW